MSSASRTARPTSPVRQKKLLVANRSEIAIRCSESVDVAALEAAVACDLAALGLERPHVSVRMVSHLERQGSGKLRRFIPLPSVPADATTARGRREAPAGALEACSTAVGH